MGPRERLTDKMTFEHRSQVHNIAVWTESIPGRGYHRCKGPEAGMSFVSFRSSKKTNVTGFGRRQRGGQRCGRGSAHVGPCRPLQGLGLYSDRMKQEAPGRS